MSRFKHVIRHTSSNAAAAAIGFTLSVLLARTVDTSSFGKISFLIATSALLAAFLDFGFSTAMVIIHNRFKGGYSESASCIYAVNKSYLRIFPLLLLFVVPILLLFSIHYNLTISEVMGCLTMSVATSCYRYCNSINQAVGEWRSYSLLTLLNPLVKIIIIPLCIVAAFFRFAPVSQYHFILIGFCFHAILIAGYGLYRTRNKLLLQPFPTVEIKSQFYHTLLPIGLTGLLATASMRLDTFIIKQYLGDHQLAIYAVAVTVAMGFPLVTGSILDIVLKQAAEQKLEYVQQVFKHQRRLLFICVVIFIGCELLCKPAVTLVFGGKYNASILILRWLLVPYFWGMFFTPLESYFVAHEPRKILIMNCFQLLIVIAGSVLLISSYGLFAVVWSILLSRLTRWSYFAFRARLLLRESDGALL